MNMLRRLLVSCIVVFAATSLLHAADSGNTLYYTKVNIWYEDPAKIVSTNYHRGAVIPYGSKASILSKSGEKIKFTIEGQAGITFILTNVRKHSLVAIDELFGQYFSEKDPKSQNAGFNGREKENIENGTIAEGMSKEAVIVAYGYPPRHRTPALTSNLWNYWDARYARKQVTFKNDKVAKIEDIDEYAGPGRPRWYHYVP